MLWSLQGQKRGIATPRVEMEGTPLRLHRAPTESHARSRARAAPGEGFSSPALIKFHQASEAPADPRADELYTGITQHSLRKDNGAQSFNNTWHHNV